MRWRPIDTTTEKKKLITEDNVTLTGCINALKKLRNCAVCPLRFDKEKCKEHKCVPQPVINVMEFAIRQYYQKQKELKALAKSGRNKVNASEEKESLVNDLDI